VRAAATPQPPGHIAPGFPRCRRDRGIDPGPTGARTLDRWPCGAGSLELGLRFSSSLTWDTASEPSRVVAYYSTPGLMSRSAGLAGTLILAFGVVYTNGAEGDRTLNLLHAMQALSQLSYGPGSL